MKDLRVFKTEQNINRAFVNIVSNYGFQKMTIDQLCGQAMISRSTFYAHYQDKYALLETLVTKYADKFEVLAQERTEQIITHQDFVLSIKMIMTQLYEDKELLLTLLSIHENQLDLTKRWQQTLITIWQGVYPNAILDDTSPSAFIVQLNATIVLNLISWLLKNGSDESVEAVVESVFQTIYQRNR